MLVLPVWLKIKRMSEQILPKANLKAQKKCLHCHTRAAKSIAVIVVLFIVSWIPLYTFNTVICFCPGCEYPAVLVKVLIVLSHCNSAWNPALYAWGMRDFRKALLRLCGRTTRARYASNFTMEGVHSGLAGGGGHARRKSSSRLDR